MIEKINFRKLINATALVLSIIYLIYCACFAYERVCYADSAHMLFKIIQSGSFNIEAGRYPQIITQVPVILALKAGFSMQGILFVYSISFPLFFISCAAVSYFIFKNRTAPLLLIFSLTASVNYGFFHCATETHQSIAWGVLFFSWMMSEKAILTNQFKSFVQLFWGILFAVLCMHAHPVGFFFIVFSIGYYVSEKKSLKNPAIYLILLLIAVLSLFKTSQTDSSSYEGQFLSLIPRFPEIASDLSNNWTLHYFMDEKGGTYLLILLVLLFSILLMIRTGQYLKLLYYVVFNLSLWFFTVLIYFKGDSYVMMERAFMPLAFTISAAFFEMLYYGIHRKVQLFQLVFLLVVMSLAFGRISNKGEFMSSRLAYFDELHAEFQAQKICLNTNQVNMDLIQVPWPVCFESLLYSSARRGIDSCYTIAVLTEEEYTQADKTNAMNFIVPGFFGSLKINELNGTYFRIQPSAYSLKN